nr:hypothetical protein [Labilithrix luteola]
MSERVDVPSETLCEPLDALPQQLPVVGFHDEVEMVLLDAELDNLESAARRAGDSSSNGARDSLLAKTRRIRFRAHHDVNRMIPIQVGSHAMNLEAFSMCRGSAPGVLASAAARAVRWRRYVVECEDSLVFLDDRCPAM